MINKNQKNIFIKNNYSIQIKESLWRIKNGKIQYRCSSCRI